MIRSTDSQSGLPTPAVTVCPLNPQTSSGFPKNGFNLSLVDSSRIEEACKGEEGKDIARCVDKATYNLSSTVGYLQLPGNTWVGPDDMQKLWVADFTDTETGIGFALKRTYHFPLVPNPEDDFTIYFINNTDYVVFLHDPNLFLITYNGMMPIPSLRFEKPNFFAWGVVITQQHNLDLPSKPCHSLPSYSFTACVKTFLSCDIGCRLPWDTWTDQAWPVCQTLEQFRCTEQFMSLN